MNLISTTKLQEIIENKVLNYALKNIEEYSRTIYFGQVVVTDDPKNLNRVKVRIPVIDDIFYLSPSTKEQGNEKLPWVLPQSSRFIETPDNGSIVAVFISDSKTPYFGRFIHNAYTGITTDELFNSLTTDQKISNNWLIVDQAHEINIPKPKTDNEYNSGSTINYKVGIRGKDNNRVVLDQGSINIVQNLGLDNESSIDLTKDIDINASDIINILSQKGTSDTFHPVFDLKLWDYLESTMRLAEKIIILLNTTPATSPTGPCVAAPKAKKLITELKELKKDLKKLKKEGSSAKIYIN